MQRFWHIKTYRPPVILMLVCGQERATWVLSKCRQRSLSRVMQTVKGKTSHHLLAGRRRLRAEFWGRHLWARRYFLATSGNVTGETIAEYIGLQGADPTPTVAFGLPSSQACMRGAGDSLVDFSRD